MLAELSKFRKNILKTQEPHKEINDLPLVLLMLFKEMIAQVKALLYFYTFLSKLIISYVKSQNCHIKQGVTK